MGDEMEAGGEPAIGHRLVPHTADLIIEAWAPSKIECLEEAARALVGSFARVGAAITESVPIELDPDDDDALLVSVLEEVVSVVDVTGSVPVEVILNETETGGVAGVLALARVEAAEIHGPVPKGVSLSGLVLAREDGRWRCRATIDV